MLTSKELHYKTRSGRVYPQFLSETDEEVLQESSNVFDFYRSLKGKTQGEIESEKQHRWPKMSLIAIGFHKLISDLSQFDEPNADVAAQRKAYIDKAQDLRQEYAFESFDRFQEAMAEEFNVEFSDIHERLYGDLPSERRLVEVPEMDKLWLVRRYNCAQIQGILIHADSVDVELQDTSIGELRAFFRMLKFHQLIAEVENLTAKKHFKIRIDGPASIFGASTKYGLKLANLFPHIANMPRWKVEAAVKLKRKEFKLKIDSKKVKANYRSKKQAYIPEEIKTLASKVADRLSGTFVQCDTFVNFGDESYAFPDFVYTAPNGEKTYFEFFHKWHAGQLVQRIDSWLQHPEIKMIFGVSREIKLADEWLDQDAVNDQKLKPNIFKFREFPTPKAILEAVEGYQ